jgi:hypothetical protein
VTLGRLVVSKIEQACLDIQKGVPLAEIAQQYPKLWRYMRLKLKSFEKIIGDCATEKDWLRCTQRGMGPIVSEVWQYYHAMRRREREAFTFLK